MFEPIQLHPDNPHYFLFRGKPTILFTSGEHYSMVINTAFDGVKYLDTLAGLGFNHTRIYTGYKHEWPGEHNIDGNTLAVPGKDFICPWVRSDVPGALDGGNKYDLDTFNDKYFERIRMLLTEAGKRGIEFEIVLFALMYANDDGIGSWTGCPFNGANNINGIGNIPCHELNTMLHPDILEYQERYLKKMVTELNGFDNLHFEVCNEPYLQPMINGGQTHKSYVHDYNTMRIEWQQHMADLIWETEEKLSCHHMISWNYLSGLCTITEPLPHVSLYSFHYTVPEITKRNYAINKAIGMNETGIMVPPDFPKQAWMTVLGGLALYNMLDYTFIPGHEDGSYAPLPSNPGYTGQSGDELRAQLKVVNDFINKFDFVRMKPANELLLVASGLNPEYQLLAEENEQYALFHCDSQHSGYGHGISLTLKAEDGDYHAQVYDANTGELEGEYDIQARDGLLKLAHGTDKAYPGNRSCREAVRIVRVRH